MKKLLLISAIFLSLQSFGALKITGQLTNSDSVKIGDNTSYVTLTIQFEEDGTINVLTDVYKGKPAYLAGKKTYPSVLQVSRVYSIDSATVATAPTSGFAALSGKSLIDKFIYWIHWKVGEKIVADNPGFTVQVVDIKL